jgi:hypothetical protein
MAMGTRTSEQAPIWIPTTDLPVSPGHPFYARLNAILDEAGFDRFAEEQCRPFYAPAMGRPSLPPGRYFRLLMLGYFEGLDSERGIACLEASGRGRLAEQWAGKIIRILPGLSAGGGRDEHQPAPRPLRDRKTINDGI